MHPVAVQTYGETILIAIHGMTTKKNVSNLQSPRDVQMNWLTKASGILNNLLCIFSISGLKDMTAINVKVMILKLMSMHQKRRFSSVSRFAFNITSHYATFALYRDHIIPVGIMYYFYQSARLIPRPTSPIEQQVCNLRGYAVKQCNEYASCGDHADFFFFGIYPNMFCSFAIQNYFFIIGCTAKLNTYKMFIRSVEVYRVNKFKNRDKLNIFLYFNYLMGF